MAKKKSQGSYLGRSEAYRSYLENRTRTDNLLEAGLLGVSERSTKYKTILDREFDVKFPSGPAPKDYKPSIKVSPHDNDMFLLDKRTAYQFKKVLQWQIKENDELRFHLHAILLVSVWGTLETYVYSLFEQLFRLRKELLVSQEKCSYEDVVLSSEDPLAFLIEKQLTKIGRFSLADLLKYLEARVNFVATATSRNKMKSIYTLRNVIAHNTGAVPAALELIVGNAAKVSDGEVKVTKADLGNARKSIHSFVTQLERHVEGKFFQE